MNLWEVLNVDSSADLDEVRFAYLELLKSNKPEENPEGFKRIRDAFERAKQHLENLDPVSPQENTDNPVNAWIENYRDFESRVQPESWQKLISAQQELADSKVFTQLALGLFEFFLANPYLPARIWKLLDGYFAWQSNAERLESYFSEAAIRYFLYRVEHAKWLPEIDTVQFPQDYCYEQIQTYFYQRDQVYRCIRNGEICSIELAASLEKMLTQVQDEEAFLMLTKLHGRQGQLDSQLEVAQQYLACFPNSTDAQYAYFQALCSSGSHADALGHFQSMTSQHAQSAELLKIMAISAEEVGNKDLAFELYDKALAICPLDCEANFYQYLIHYKKIVAEDVPALLAVERAEVEVFRGYPDHAIELLTRAAKEFTYAANPKCVAGLEKLSLALLRFNLSTQLKNLLKPVIEIERNNGVLLFCLAEAYRALLRPEKALGFLSQIEPSVPVLWSKSSALLDLRRYQEAMAVCRALLKQVPTDWTLFQRIGHCLQGLGNRTEALLQYQKALELSPNDFSCYCAVMDQALTLGKAELAQATFHQLLVREIAPQKVLDYWGMYANGLGAQLKEESLV